MVSVVVFVVASSTGPLSMFWQDRLMVHAESDIFVTGIKGAVECETLPWVHVVPDRNT